MFIFVIAEIVNDKGLDVFGQVPTTRKQNDCICPNCHRNMAESRFAPHLEKCMGMGGSIPRVASRRHVYWSDYCMMMMTMTSEDDDDDDDNENKIKYYY